MMNSRILRSGNPADVETYFQNISFRKKMLTTFLPIAIIILIATTLILVVKWKVKANFVFDSAGQDFLMMTFYLFVPSTVMAMDYDTCRNRNYFFADVPDINGWRHLRWLLWFSLLFPAMMMSVWQMKRKRQSDLEWERKDQLALFGLMFFSIISGGTRKNLTQYCFENWKETVAQTRQEKQQKIKNLHEQIREYEHKIEEIRQELKATEQYLSDYPEGAKPNKVEETELEGVFEKLRAMPEIPRFSASKTSNGTEVYIAVKVEYTSSDQTKYNLGAYGLNLKENGCTCCCLVSGMTALGHARFPRLDDDDFCQELAQIISVDHFYGHLDTLVAKFIEIVHQRKIAGISEEELHYYFREAA